MPKNSDFKKIVRARMSKTGESYSIARMHAMAATKTNGAGKPAGFKPTAFRPVAILGAVVQLRIALAEIKPAIWRSVQVSSEVTLADLHTIIQAGMGWSNSHLHQFVVDGQRYGRPDMMDDAPAMADEHKVTLRQIADAAEIGYEYDFGDSWHHLITVENRQVSDPPPDGLRALCVDGRRACPPEDCGGAAGYERMIAILADPRDNEHEEMRSWVGGKFDPEGFDLNAVNRDLRRQRLGPRRATARKGAPIVSPGN